MIGFVLSLVLSVAVGGALLGGVSSLRSCGSSMAEADFLADQANREAAKADRLERAVVTARTAETAARGEAAAAQAMAASHVATIRAMEKEGEDTQCLVDCRLPSLD